MGARPIAHRGKEEPKLLQLLGCMVWEVRSAPTSRKMVPSGILPRGSRVKPLRSAWNDQGRLPRGGGSKDCIAVSVRDSVQGVRKREISRMISKKGVYVTCTERGKV